MPILLLTIDQKQFTAEQIAALKEKLPQGMSLLLAGDEDIIKEAAQDVEILAGWFDPDWFEHMPNLRWVQMWSAGANWLMNHAHLREATFILTSAVGVHAVPISEHVFALILAFGRRLPNAFAAQKESAWAKIMQKGEPLDTAYAFSMESLFELAGQTILLLGVGAIGERVAKLAQAFDMVVIGVRNNPQLSSAYVNQMVGPERLLEVLPAADFVVNTLPLTEATEGLIGQRELRAMKSSAFLINIGRGKTVNEEALAAALQDGTIAGAGLDVFEEEPLPEDSPLWKLPNVIITSHYSGATPQYHARALDILFDNLERYKNKEPLRNVVDKQLGY